MKFGDELSRRKFLQNSALATAAVAIPSGVFASGSAQIKVGLIGSGGRGHGAALDALAADPDVVIWAIGDVFEDRAKGAAAGLTRDHKARVQVTPERTFTGFDAYQKVLASGIDVVILTTPPGFRPMHFKA